MPHPLVRTSPALLALALAAGGISQAAAAQAAAPGTPAAPGLPQSLEIVAQRHQGAPIVIDGVLDEAEWGAAQVVELPYEWFPGDNVDAPVRTECRVTYDERNLYFGCLAHDPDPSRIRARLADRDRADQDDYIEFVLDPFNDQRHGYQFRVNPLGVQMDALVGVEENTAWDAIWNSAGRLTPEGYVVEVAIPFKSLRFPRTAALQEWGIIIGRSYPRSVQHRIRSVPTDRNQSCLLCQSARLSGLQGIAPGRDIELSPTLTADRQDARAAFPAGEMVHGKPSVEPGLTMRWGLSPNVSLSGTVNPDFSQVETDVIQLQVNERFAVQYPEKRPFFLDGADVFQTLLPAVFTRTVVNPHFGVRTTGKEGPSAFGAFATVDRVNALLIPSNQGSASLLLDQEVTTGTARYRRDVGASSTIGALYVGRSGGQYQNHVGGVDGFLRLSRTNVLRVQYLRSQTEYPDDVAAGMSQPDGNFGGDAMVARLTHGSRNWVGMAELQNITGSFRADAGFLPRVDTRVARATGERVFWGQRGGWFNRLAVGAFGEYLTDGSGALTDQGTAIYANYQGARQTMVNWGVGHNRKLHNGEMFDLLDTRLTLSARPNRTVSAQLQTRFGDEVDFANTRKAQILQVSPLVVVRMGRAMEMETRYTRQQLATTSGERIFAADLGQTRLVYHLGRRTFVRGVLQYRHVGRDPNQYQFTVPETEQSLLTQLLFSYKVNPQTVLFLGYTDDRLGIDETDLLSTGRSFFMKVGYALRL